MNIEDEMIKLVNNNGVVHKHFSPLFFGQITSYTLILVYIMSTTSKIS